MTEFRENRDVRRPFLSTPDARVYFPASAIEKARRSVARCLRRGEGVALVVGEPGMGKTLLARTIASEFDGQDQASVVSASRKLNVKAFLQQFMFGLRQKFCGCDETEMRLMTLDYLERSPQRRCVLLVDDAHNLSAPVFDEIRTLVDQAAGASKELAVALFGGAALEDRLNLPQLYPFQQRIVCRAYLDAFSYAETRRFIDRELKRSGIAAAFTKDAKDRVANLSAGVPRVITQICDRALWLASDGALELSDGELETSEAPKKRAEPFWTIDIKEVERAWNNLQNIKQEEEEEESEPPAADDSSPTVEFGLLDDDEDGEYNESGDSEEPVPQENNVTVTVDTEFNSSAAEETPEAEEASETVEVSAELDNDDEQEEEQQEETAEEVQAEAQDETPEAETADRDAEPVETAAQELGSDISERRSAAKRAFWNEDDVFVPGAKSPESRFVPTESADVETLKEELAAAEPASAPEEVEAEPEISAQENAGGEVEEEEEEEETSSLGEEIDEELDARLREKFGFTLDSFKSENEDIEEEEEESESEPQSYDLYQDGMKFEIRNRSEIADRAAAFSQTFSTPQNEPDQNAPKNGIALDMPDVRSSYAYDASLEFSPNSGGPRYIENKKSGTRRPIRNGDDGSKEYREFNGFNAEEAAAVAADDSKLDSRYDLRPEPGESALSLNDRAYRQIVASQGQTPEQAPSQTPEQTPASASDRYLNELDLLEQEIAEEANLIRRIRNIHMQLRSTVENGLNKSKE